MSAMKIQAIYDNGGKTFDRYTVVTNQQWGISSLGMLGLSEHPNDPQGFSQWGGGTYSEGGLNDHIGSRVHFEHLSAELQEHIARRVFAENEDSPEMCEFVRDGEEDGLEWFRCTVHDELSLDPDGFCSAYYSEETASKHGSK